MTKRDKLKKKFFGEIATKQKTFWFAKWLLNGGAPILTSPVGDCLPLIVDFKNEDQKTIKGFVKKVYKAKLVHPELLKMAFDIIRYQEAKK